jgi:hypothetical protein
MMTFTHNQVDFRSLLKGASKRLLQPSHEGEK